MPYTSWPSGATPFTPTTHITDRVSLIDHRSIKDGLARDIGNLQYNINTTNLFASGWLHPVVSGFFDNIDTNNLNVYNLICTTFYIGGLAQKNYGSITFNDSGKVLHFYDVAFKNYDIPIQNFFSGWGVEFTPTGIILNTSLVSGGNYGFSITETSSRVSNMQVEGTISLVSGSLNIPDSKGRLLIDNTSAVSIIGSIDESNISWKSYGGHDHTLSKIISKNIASGDINYTSDLVSTASDASIYATSGTLDITGVTCIRDSVIDYDFYEVGGSSSGNYKDQNLGTHLFTTYKDKFYSMPISGKYLYSSNDLITWDRTEVMGLTNGTIIFPEAKCVYYPTSLKVYNNDLWIHVNVHATGYIISYQSPTFYAASVLQKLSDIGGSTCAFLSGGCPELDPIKVDGIKLIMNSSIEVADDKLWFMGQLGPYNETLPTVGGSYYGWDKFKISGGYATSTAGKETLINDSITYGKPVLMYVDLQGGSSYQFNRNMNGKAADGYNYTCIPSQFNTSGGLFGNGFNSITSIVAQRGRSATGNERYVTSSGTVDGVLHYGERFKTISQSSIMILGVGYHLYSGDTYSYFPGAVPLYTNISCDVKNSVALTPEKGSISMIDGSLINNMSFSFAKSLVTDYNITSWLVSGSSQLSNRSNKFGTLCAPFVGTGCMFYKHDSESSPTSIGYGAASPTNFSNIGLDPESLPIKYYNRQFKVGFWSSKTMDWYYNSNGLADCPSSGSLPKTWYYCEPMYPISHCGTVYVALKDNTGYVKIDAGGPEYIDDDVMYTDLILYDGEIYGVGNHVSERDFGIYSYSFQVRKIHGKQSTPITVKSRSVNNVSYKFTINRGKLYIGIGNGRFLVKRPSFQTLSYAKRF